MQFDPLLNQLYIMLLEAPEFFYSSLTANKTIATRDVARFAVELKKLFGVNHTCSKIITVTLNGQDGICGCMCKVQVTDK